MYCVVIAYTKQSIPTKNTGKTLLYVTRIPGLLDAFARWSLFLLWCAISSQHVWAALSSIGWPLGTAKWGAQAKGHFRFCNLVKALADMSCISPLRVKSREPFTATIDIWCSLTFVCSWNYFVEVIVGDWCLIEGRHDHFPFQKRSTQQSISLHRRKTVISTGADSPQWGRNQLMNRFQDLAKSDPSVEPRWEPLELEWTQS